MSMKQITILTHNAEAGILAEITEALANEAIDLHDISGEQFGEQAVITVKVDNVEKAFRILQKNPHWQIVNQDVLLVKIKDEIGGLAKLARRFADEDISLQSIRFVERHTDENGNDYALVAISTARSDKALKVVQDIRIN